MKTGKIINALPFILAFAILFMLSACSKDSSIMERKELHEQEESFRLPGEIAQHLTKEELEEIYFSEPPSELPSLEGQLENRSAGWHFWVAWGDLPNETFYAVIGNCSPFEVPDNICFAQADCPDPSTWIGQYADAYGDFQFVLDRHQRGISNMTHHFNNMICFGSGDWPSFGFLPNGGPDLAQFRPSTIPGEVVVTPGPELFEINAVIYPCNPSNLHPVCWNPSTGIFENMQGSLRWNFVGETDEILGQGIFGLPADAFVIVWGWLYY